MPHITTILGNEPGIQYQGVTDKTGSTGSTSINNIFIGKFKRGRLDKPMTITKANIRGMLGYDPKNLDYVAVQDALDTNIESIQVLRVSENDCVCTSDLYTLSDLYAQSGPMNYGSVIYKLKINEKVFNAVIPNTTSYSIEEGISAVFTSNYETELMNLLSYSLSSSNNGELYLQNLQPECVKLELTASVVLQSNSTNSVNDPVYSTIKLIENVELCAYEPST
jgi:hypothetical protein